MDAALLFGALAFVVVAGQILGLLGISQQQPYRFVTTALVVALPYLLLRLAADFSRVPRGIMTATLVGLLPLVAGLAVIEAPLPTWFTLAIVAYFCTVELYATVRFVAEARQSTGVSRRRMTAAAGGSLFLGLAVLVAGLAVLFPAVAVLTRVFAFGAALAYAAAFATPSFLRHAWQDPDLREFLQRAATTPATAGVAAVTAELEQAAARVLGAPWAGIGLWDEQAGELRFSNGETQRPGDGAAADVFAGQRAAFVQDIGRQYPLLAERLRATGLRAVLAAPVTIRGRRLGVFAVRSRRASIFAADDLGFLGLLADHAAVVIENAQLLAEVRRLHDEERRRGEGAIARLALIVGSSVDAILGVTPEGVITDWNPAAERLYGYTAAEAIGRPVSILVPPERQEEIPLLLDRVARDDPVAVHETVQRHRDGRTMDVSLSVSPTRDDAGRITGVAVIARDVTESKVVEARFRGMVDAALDALVGMDEEGNVIEWSRHAEATFGWTREEVLGRPLVSLIIPERYRAAHRAGLAHFRRTGEGPVLRKRLELEAVARDGREFPVELSIMPVETRAGHVFSAFVRDITERRRQERALKALQDVAFATGHMLDPERLAAFTVEKAREVLGIQTAALYLWDDAERVLMLAARSHTGDHPGLPRVRPGEGLSGIAYERREPVVVQDYANWPHRVASGGGMIACGIAVPLFVSERVIGTLLLSSYTPHTLASTDVEFLTLFASEVAPALEASRLLLVEQRQKVAEAANRAKSEFLANMSHELRTPLNAILGFSDLLAEQLHEQLNEAQRRYLRNVRESGEHLLELINDVLDLSKVEAGRLELRAEVVRLVPLLEPVVASARASADTAGLAFEAVVPDDGVVRADPARLRQILYNLLSNALKFTSRGGSVRLVMRFEGADMVVEVADTGLGIPASERHRVFGTFERLHEGRSEATGTGLGLALTKRLVELHRGSITFESEEGRGTTFRVVLPEARVEPVHGDRLLVVEDVEADADLIVALAAEVGLRSEVVTSARAAIDAMREDPPRGVVLDLRLPDERGERVLEALKAEPHTRAIPVIVVTVEDDEGRSRPLGADDHLTKPIDRQRLAAWLRSVKDT